MKSIDASSPLLLPRLAVTETPEKPTLQYIPIFTPHLLLLSHSHSTSRRSPTQHFNMELKQSGNPLPFKFNAHAPEFVPRSHSEIPISSFYYPFFSFLSGASVAPDLFAVGNQESTFLIPNQSVSHHNCLKNVLTDDVRRKIINQVEYLFSDMNLIANESFAKHVNKDPEGYVPISFVASTKKIKFLTTNNHMLAQALQSSSKLVVSEDGKKIRRKHPLTDKEKEELQSRTVVAENLPEDHSYQNLQKLFSSVGSVKTIRMCHPQDSNSSRPKGEFYCIGNKLHALVEYESLDVAERAVEKLTDERNWRKGLRVRLLLRLSPKSVLKTRKSDFDGMSDDDDAPSPECMKEPMPEMASNRNAEDSVTGSKKGWSRGHGKGRGRSQNHIGQGVAAAPPSPQPMGSTMQVEVNHSKHNSKGPRMPDGTKGFAVGRGKSIRTGPAPAEAALDR